MRGKKKKLTSAMSLANRKKKKRKKKQKNRDESLTDSRSVSSHRSKPKGPEIHTVACINYRRPKVKSLAQLSHTHL